MGRDPAFDRYAETTQFGVEWPDLFNAVGYDALDVAAGRIIAGHNCSIAALWTMRNTATNRA